LNVIFDVIGTPKGAQIDRARTSEAREYLRSLEPREPVDLKEKYRAADDACIDLLRRMLLFFPEDRITAEESLAHPFFAAIRRPETEVRLSPSDQVVMFASVIGFVCNDNIMSEDVVLLADEILVGNADHHPCGYR
jgi:serine/threonine protein kinase